jgi:hypothetical protein
VLAPGIAIVISVMYSTDTRLRSATLLGLTIAALVIPFGLELVGVWPGAFQSIDGDLRIHLDFLDVHPTILQTGLLLYVVVVVLISGRTARRIALNERTAMKAVELQAWHLRQLVQAA